MHVDATSNHKHDFCCTHYVHCFLNEHEDGYSLKYIVYQRSQDSVFGYNNDINWHYFVYNQMIIELTNKLKVPIYREDIECNVGSLHVYERHFKVLE
jgi:thymidylate synthase